MRILILGLIRLYQLVVSPLLPGCCRFHPSCSEYTLQAIEKLGVARGALFGIRRVLRCHPWSVGGADPAP